MVRTAAGRMGSLIVALAVTAVTVIYVPASASASTHSTVHRVSRVQTTAPTSPGQHPASRVCPEPTHAGEMACRSLVRTDVVGPKGVRLNVAPAGFGPADLRSAYALPSTGSTDTVAIVDAFDDPTAESDLGLYRQQYGLPSCTTANGCFKKINQRGDTSYPPPNSGWSGEISLDVDMVSAVCPTCKILLVEADNPYISSLGTAVNQAVAQGAKYVSNSYGGSEGSDEAQSDDAYFHHPGVAVTASSGDASYGVQYPAASPYVTAVGGTALVKDTLSTRGWRESAWSGAGSGCSGFEIKPSFQHDTGCARRTVADVSAVADPNTGVAVYYGGWHVYGGTSVSAPIIASVYALAAATPANSAPNSFPYALPSALNDVTSGNNGSCTPAYLCTAGPGYDGPTGLGTPNGIGAFRSGPHGIVSGTVTDGSRPLAGAEVSVTDTRTMTDGQGKYSLTVPTGTYDVTASKFGYNSKTVSGVVVGNGQTVTEKFALTAKVHVKVSGLVRDGSGHGWPLYATVRVEGEPTAVAYTDPKTGRYSLSLPAGNTYTLQVDPLYPGYLQQSQDVQLGSMDVIHDVNAPVDPTTCSAAGYGYHYAGTTEPFDGTTAPPGWTVTDNTGNSHWVFNDPQHRGNLTGGSGGFAVIDNLHDGWKSRTDSSLVSPVTDFSKRTHPILAFRTDYESLTFKDQVGDVDLSVDGGQSWSNVWHQANGPILGPVTENVDLSQAAGKSAVQVRFHFTAAYGWWWQVDDVFLGDRTCDPTPGGLVVGQVLDKNTGAGINGATVTSADQPTEKVTSAATPDDPNLGDGFYYMFSLTGSHKFTATAGYYSTKNVTVNVAANSASEGTFSLPAPRIAASPATVSKTVAWQGQGSAALTLKNTGSAPVTVNIGDQPGGYQPAADGAPLQKVKGDFSPGRFLPDKTAKAAAKAPATPSAPPWTTVADYPSPIMDNGVATIGGKVYSVAGTDGASVLNKAYAYDPTTLAWSSVPDLGTAREAPETAAFNGKLYVFGGWDSRTSPTPKTEIYNPASGAWSTGADNPKPYAGAGITVLNGKIYIVGGCGRSCGTGTTDVQVYDPAANSWRSAKAYPESISWLGCGAIKSKLYCAGGWQGSTSIKHAYSYDPSSDSWTSVADLPIDLWGMGYAVAGGQLLISGGVTSNALTNQGFAYNPASNVWTALPNSNNSVYRGGSACGFYKIGGSTGGFTAVKNSELLPGYDQCSGTTHVPWLSENKTKVTIQPGAAVKVTVNLNAHVHSITQPGTYTAQLTISAKTPYRIAPVPVTLAVKPPKTWGKITGTITGAGCTGKHVPLAGVTVQIDSGRTSFTLKTDENGRYVLWLDVRNNPLTLIAAKDGWAPQTRSVKINQRHVTTADFTLKPDQSCS